MKKCVWLIIVLSAILLAIVRNGIVINIHQINIGYQPNVNSN